MVLHGLRQQPQSDKICAVSLGKKKRERARDAGGRWRTASGADKLCWEPYDCGSEGGGGRFVLVNVLSVAHSSPPSLPPFNKERAQRQECFPL